MVLINRESPLAGGWKKTARYIQRIELNDAPFTDKRQQSQHQPSIFGGYVRFCLSSLFYFIHAGLMYFEPCLAPSIFLNAL